MNKYRTPLIEEFHVGFEFECKIKDWAEVRESQSINQSKKWYRTKVHEFGTLNLNGLRYLINNKCVRIKI